jgi:hypothetical protein
MNNQNDGKSPRHEADADPIGTAVGSHRTARLDSREIAFMLATIARIPDVFLVARFQLTTDLFDASEAHFVLVVRAIFAAAESNGGLIPQDRDVARELICLKCASEIATDTTRRYYNGAVEKKVLDDGGLLDMVFAMPISKEVTAEGMTLLRRFITERKVADAIVRAFAGITSRDTIDNPVAMIARIEGHARSVVGLGVDPGSPAVVDQIDFLPPGAAVVSTQVPWLDEVMNGGHAPMEAYVILGPTGGGKSALGVQIAVEGAELQNQIAAEIGPLDAGRWYYVSYELTENQMRERVYAYGAKIHRDTFKGPKRRELTKAEARQSMHEYEFEPFVNSPGNPLMGEYDRLTAFNKRLSGVNDRLTIVDYSGQHPGHGVNGVEEIAGYMKRERARGHRIAGVVIDYAGLCAERMVNHRRLRPEAVYPALAAFMDQVRSLISIPFECPSWVLHQFHGDVNKKAPGARTSHSEAQGSRNFANNADFTFGLSPYNRNTGLLTVTMSKSRRAPGREDDTIVKFDGRFGAFITPDQDYVVDPQTRQIVPRNYLDSLPIRPGGRGLPPPVNPLDGM